MSSDNRKRFKANGTKAAGQEFTSSPIAMPDNTEGHVLSVKTDASCTGVVDVELEMSPDGVNWCPAVTRTVSATSGAAVPDVIGNEEYVKLTPDAGEWKNKHARGGLNFDVSGNVVTPDGTGARDLLDQHIAVNKSFNYSQWFKTSEAPTTTYKPVLFRHGGYDNFENTKTIELTDTSGTFFNEYAIEANPVGDSAGHGLYQNNSFMLGVDTTATTNRESFSVSFWVKNPTYLASVFEMRAHTATNKYTSFGVAFHSGGNISILIHNTTGNAQAQIVTPANGWNSGWNHVVVNTVASGSSSYYWEFIINGATPQTTSTLVVPTLSSSSLLNHAFGILGQWYGSFTGTYGSETPAGGGGTGPMAIDEFAVWNDVLTQTDAIAMYNGASPTDLTGSTNLHRYYRFKDGANDTGTSIENLVNPGATDAITSSSDYTIALSSGTDGSMYVTPDKTTQNLCEPNTQPFSSIFSVSNSFSISGWFKTTDTGTLFSDTGGTATSGLKVDVTSSGITASYLDSNLSTSVTGTFNDGDWHHISMVMSPGSQLIVVDNISSGTSNHTLLNADLRGSNTFTLLGDGQHNANAASPASTDASKLNATLSNWSVHSEALSTEAISHLYSNGHVRNLKNLPSVNPLAIEAWWQLNDTVNPENDLSGNNYHLQYQDGSSNTLVSQQVNADGATLVEDTINGNAMTLSLTKSFNFTTNEWVSTADQDTALCLSFNGFEEQAEHVALWKCSQTIAGETIDLCDGGWHNVVLSYRGNNDLAGDNVAEGDVVKFGPGPAQSLPFNWCMSFDGQALTGIKDGSGADYIDGLGTTITDTYSSTTYNVGFNIYNRHLKYETSNTEEEYKPHAQFSAGIHEVTGVDNINAFQGSVDETSFHSDCWWVDQAGTSVLTTAFNAEKPAAIYGNTTALTNRGSGTDYPEGVPYPLLNPEKIGSASGGNQWINPERYDASTNPNGGLEGWWRWGDTPGDCSITINDVRDHDDSINARDIAAFGIVTADRQDMTVTPESIYLENTETTGAAGVSISFPQVVVEGIEAGICNLKQMASPILKYLRVKFTGAGSCDLGAGSTQAQINFRVKE